MKRFTRLLAVILTVAALAASLLGCGNAAGAMKPGTYTGVGAGHAGEVRARVVIGNDGTIKSVEIVGENEDEEYGKKAVETLPGIIAEEQSLGVDAVSGATVTSRGILAAVADAVAQAGGDPEAMGYVPEEEISKADVIRITGLPDGDAQVTGEQLRADYEATTLEAVSVNSSGEEKKVTATGVLLEDILAKLGTSQTGYGSIVTTATDGYSIEIPDGILKTRDILIAYEVNGEPQSPRTVIPDERAMYWTKFLSTIELVDAAQMEETEAAEILLMETAISVLEGQAEDYKHYDATEKALPVSAFLGRYAPEKTEFVNLRSIDQLNKNEKYDTFAAQYIMYTGDAGDIPLYTGPALPEGMRVKQLLNVRVGAVDLVSLAMAQKVAGKDAVLLEQLFGIAGMKEAQSYTLEAADGYSVEISAADVSKGTVSFGEGGLPSVSFEGLEKNTGLKDLLRIVAN